LVSPRASVPVLSFGRGLARTVASEQVRRSFLTSFAVSSGFEALCEVRWSLGTGFRLLAGVFTARRDAFEWVRGHDTLPHITAQPWWASQGEFIPAAFALGPPWFVFSLCSPPVLFPGGFAAGERAELLSSNAEDL
jgi:hypothetical protein